MTERRTRSRRRLTRSSCSGGRSQPSAGPAGNENGGACIRLGIITTIAAALIASSASSTIAAPQHRLACYHAPRPRACLVRWWRDDTWRLQYDLGRHRSPTSYAERRSSSPAFLDWMRRLWKHRARRLDAAWPPWSAEWFREALCVHGHEASWHNPTGIGPDVSGGMQIGRHEWQHFGGDHWTSEAYLAPPRIQLEVAYRYWRVSRWGPWPESGAACGLL